jgi:hypothetical protein
MAMISNSFKKCPELDVKYTIGGQGERNLSLRLPIYLNKFIEGVSMSSDAFSSNWQNIT